MYKIKKKIHYFGKKKSFTKQKSLKLTRIDAVAGRHGAAMGNDSMGYNRENMIQTVKCTMMKKTTHNVNVICAIML